MPKKIVTKVWTGLCLLSALNSTATPGGKTTPFAAQLMKQQATAPISFTENHGQVADTKGNIRPDVLFTAHSGHLNVFLTATGIDYQFTRIRHPAGYEPGDAGQQEILKQQTAHQTHHFSLTLEGANAHAKVIRNHKSRKVENFYLAHCPNGIINVPGYEQLVYENVYPGIDWVIYSAQGHLKYDFIVKPGGDAANIRLRIKDADNAGITKEGALLMKTSLGEIKENAPLSYADGVLVKSSFRENGDGTIGFAVAAQPGKTLRIDPTVIWSTYYGGPGEDYAMNCMTDNNSNIYIAGYTSSTSAVALNGFQNTIGGGYYDSYIAKLDSNGFPIWATYYGGTGDEYGHGLARDNSGNIYLAGWTDASTNLASGGFQNAPTSSANAYLVKFTNTGTRIWGTYYSGAAGTQTSTNSGQPVCTDASGNVYLIGTTTASGLASGGFQNTIGGGQDAYLVKFSPTGSRLWATYYGGTVGDNAIGSCVDGSGNIYITGLTGSTGMASGGYQNTLGGGTDAYLAKFDPSGARLWATYYGGSGSDQGFMCITDNSNNVYMGGNAVSAGLATASAPQTTVGGVYDALLVKFNASGTRQWATYYGGSSTDQFRSAAFDTAGNLCLVGFTSSPNAIGSSGFQNTIGGSSDAMVVKFTQAGSLIWGSYFGQINAEQGWGCAADKSGNIFMAGYTGSTTGIGMPGTYQPNYGGDFFDAFLAKIGDVAIYTGTITGSPFCAGATVNVPFTIYGSFNSINVFTAQLSDSSGSFANPVNIGTLSGTAAGTITATIPPTTLAGTKYRIRVISSSPAVIGLNNGVNITINGGTGSATATIAANPGNSICAGTSVTFTATPSNGGPTPSYQWLKNGNPVGTNSTTYTSNTLANNDIIRVVITGSITCATRPDTSAPITMIVTSSVTPSVTIAANPGNTICAGTTVTFKATPVNGGLTKTYQWRKNGLPVGINDSTYTDNGLVGGDVITVRLTSSALCRTADTANSNSITMTVNTAVTPSVTINVNPNDTICAGTTVTFTPVPVGGGTPAYQWRKNGANVSTSGIYTTNAIANGDVISVRMISNAACRSADSAGSSVTMTVISNLVPSVTITALPAGPICSGTSVTFTAAPVNGGTGTYIWRKNGALIVGATGQTYTSSTLSNGDVITTRLTSNISCRTIDTVNSPGITMAVTNSVVPAVTVGVSPTGTVCAGTNVLFTAIPINGGTTPAYYWRKNGLPVGGNAPTYPDNTLTSTDVITVRLTSNETCRTLDTVSSTGTSVTVTPSVTPTVTASVNPGNVICAGISVAFTATATNGGTSPAYQWRKNGITVSNTPGYTTSFLNDGDTIICILASSLTCTTQPTDTSNPIIMTVSSVVAPTVTITANPGIIIASGTNVTFTATITNGGAAPVYQWKKNGVNVGTNNATYSSNVLVSGDIITCTVTSSNTCASPNTGNSNPLTIRVSTGIGQVGNSGNDLTLFPNPNQGTFRLKGTLSHTRQITLEVVNAVGQSVYQMQLPVSSNTIDQQITLKESIANGTYLLRVRSDNGMDMLRFVLSR